MNRSGITSAAIFLILGVIQTSAVAADEPCRAPASWFPKISQADLDALFKKVPRPDHECDFYQFSFANFLFAVQSESDGGKPRFLEYKTYEGLFGSPLSVTQPAERLHFLSLTPRLVKEKLTSTDFDGIEQAGLVGGVLIDQAGNPIFYAMHFNDAFAGFVSREFSTNGSLDPTKLLEAKPDNHFPTGVLEFKSAWRVKPKGESLESFQSKYITADALIPTLVASADAQHPIKIDATRPIPTTVGLIGLHVVGVVEGHPEFVWATFEHRKNAPQGKAGKPQDSEDPVDPTTPDFTLYQKGKSYRDSNPVPLTIGLTLNKDGTVSPPTSVYRVFPPGFPDDDGDDPQVKDLTDDVMGKLDAKSVIRNYKMIGAVWINKPEDFVADTDFADKQLAGEIRLSSTSMESFTQTKFPNCFSCHSTTQVMKMPPTKLNVSHAITKFANK